MFRRYWHIGLAFILALIASTTVGFLLWPSENRPFMQPQSDAVAAYDAGGAGCTDIDLKAIRSEIRRRKTEEDCASNAKAHRTEQENLNEARKASFEAKEANRIALEQSKNSALQSAAIMFTIVIAVWAAWEAGQAVIVTRQVGQDQSRAYVHIDSAALTWGSGEIGQQSIVLTATNTGQTPAKWIEINTVVFTRQVQKRGEVIDDWRFDEINFGNKVTKRWPALGAGMHLPLYPNVRSPAFEAAFDDKEKGKIICIAGTLRYETIFNELYESEYWFHLYPPHIIVHEPLPPTENTMGLARRISTPEVPQVMYRANAQMRTYEKAR